MDLKAQASATEASELEAASTLARTKALARTGHQTTVAVERAEGDAKVAAQNQKSLNHRLFASVVELEAARRGEYVGDSYNDRPSSLQHADDLSVRIAEAEAELSCFFDFEGELRWRRARDQLQCIVTAGDSKLRSS